MTDEPPPQPPGPSYIAGIDVFVANEQTDVEVDEHRVVALGRLAAEEQDVDPRAELSVLLVDRAAMSSLKERWLGESGPTDVLAFPMEDRSAEGQPFLLGDIVICPDVAREQAGGEKVTQEVDLLLVHGFLHLLGLDHIRPQEAKAMRHRERRILHEFGRRWPA